MGKAIGELNFGEFITLHEGIPLWFPRLVSYILNSLQGKDRFNIYNASRLLNSTGQTPFVFASDIREVLERFDGCGLSFSGNHKQKIFIKKPLIFFWTSFFLHVQNPLDHDLGFFALVLQRRRFNDIVNDAFLRAHLPGSCRSLSKNRIIAILLKEVFKSPEDYSKYVQDRLSRLSGTAKEIFHNLSREPIGFSILSQEYTLNTPHAVYDLCDALLVKPMYFDISGSLHLHISKFRGFENPHLFPVTTPLPSPRIFECLNKVQRLTTLTIQSAANEFQEELCGYQFPKRQILLFEQCFTFARIVLDFLAWWRETLGTCLIKKEWLPQDNYTLTQDHTGGYRVLALEEYNPDQYIREAINYEFLNEDSCGDLIMTELGIFAGGGSAPEMNVKTVWGRNVDRVSITLGATWSKEFRTLLNDIGCYHGQDRFDISKKEVLARGISEGALLLVLGGFVDLNNKRLSRLRRWFFNEPIPKILHAAAIPIAEIVDTQKILKITKTGKCVCQEVSGFLIIIGITRSQLLKSLEI